MPRDDEEGVEGDGDGDAALSVRFAELFMRLCLPCLVLVRLLTLSSCVSFKGEVSCCGTQPHPSYSMGPEMRNSLTSVPSRSISLVRRT